jgi:quercetin dioxygenase-like cupin family protein
MRLVVTGEGPDGRSRVEEITEIAELDEPEGKVSVAIWTTTSFPPPLPIVRKKTIEELELDLGVPPGAALAQYTRMGPGRVTPVHRTHTLDIAVITAGSAELILQDGSVDLLPGDTIVMPGIIHQWKVGPGGLVIVGTSYGVEAP